MTGRAADTATPSAHAEDRRAAETRAAILRESDALFAHYGFAKTTVGDIAKHCGMSPGNLYRYFRNKQDIGRAVVTGFFRVSEAEMQGVLATSGGGAEARIRAFIHTGVGHLVREMEQNPRIVELAEFICTDTEGRAELEAHIDWRRDRIAEEIARGQAEGLFAPGDPVGLAETIQLAVKGFWVPMMLAFVEDKSAVPARLDRILDLIFAGLRAR